MSVDSESAPILPSTSKLGLYSTTEFPSVFTDVKLDSYTSPSFLPVFLFYPRIWLNPAPYWSVVESPLLRILARSFQQGWRADTGDCGLEFTSTTLIPEGGSDVSDSKNKQSSDTWGLC